MNVTDKVGDNQQQMTIAGLDFETMQDNFSNGRLHIVCHANVFHLYQKKADVHLIEERPKLASVLGTRESSYIGRFPRLSFDKLYCHKLYTLHMQIVSCELHRKSNVESFSGSRK